MKILLVLILSSHVFAVQNASKLSPDAKEAMIADIAGGRSLLEAGKTGD